MVRLTHNRNFSSLWIKISPKQECCVKKGTLDSLKLSIVGNKNEFYINNNLDKIIRVKILDKRIAVVKVFGYMSFTYKYTCKLDQDLLDLFY
jgi:hypothetical protein